MTRFQLKRPPTHPGEILKEEFLSPLGITKTELAKARNKQKTGKILDQGKETLRWLKAGL